MQECANAYIIAQMNVFSQLIFAVFPAFCFLSLQNYERYAILAKDYDVRSAVKAAE